MTDIRSVDPPDPPRNPLRDVLTPGVLAFLAALHERFEPTRLTLLDARSRRYEQLVAGENFGFLAETEGIRCDRDWRVASPAAGLVDRRVEITGPTERKMTVN